MRILSLESGSMDLVSLPETLSKEIHFSVLDNSTPQNPDFFFNPLMFLETFSSPAAVLHIGQYEIMLPLDWMIVIGDGTTGNDLEVLSITSIHNRSFEVFSYNPITSFRPEFESIEVVNIYNNVKWYFPKLNSNQLLTYPLLIEDKTPCVFVTPEISKTCEMINYPQLV